MPQILDKNYLKNLEVLNAIHFNGILYGRIQTYTKNCCFNNPEDYKYFTLKLHVWNRVLMLQRSPILSHLSPMLQADMISES